MGLYNPGLVIQDHKLNYAETKVQRFKFCLGHGESSGPVFKYLSKILKSKVSY